MNNKWRSLFFLTPAVCVTVFAVFGLLCNQPIFPVLSGNAPAGNLEKVADAKEKKQSEVKKKTAKKIKQKGLQDGEYTGSAKGFGGLIVVKVQIFKGKIKSIDVVSHEKETPAYYSKAKKVISLILSSQSTDVDTISGATFSSSGILQAVQNALRNAGGKKEKSSVKIAAHKTNKKEQRQNKVTSLKGIPKDGVYTGTAECEKFGYGISLKAKFKNGQVVALYQMKMLHNKTKENVSYMQKSWKGMVRRILKSQNKNVDVISGATYSSQAVWAAYQNAYAKAIGKKEEKKSRPKATKSPILPDSKENVSVGQIKDGSYLVKTICSPDVDMEFEPYTLQAVVVFREGRCVSINNFSSDCEENQPYYIKAANGTKKEQGVVNQILQKQKIEEISAVSGATCSSQAICNLYRQALLMAANTDDKASDVKSSEPPAVNSPKPEETLIPTPEPSYAPLQPLKNGSYSETTEVLPDEDGDFSSYRLSADVVFKENAFAGFENVEISDITNKFYTNRALNGTRKSMGLLNQLIGAQKDDALVVTGATCSSHAFLTLYRLALAEARKQ